MLACDQTITVVRCDGDRYDATVIHGVSWFEKLKVSVQERGLVSANTFTVRIPAGQLPDGYLPQTMDVVVHGEIAGPIQRPVDLEQYRRFTVLGVGDNRRKPSRRPHVVVTGA